MSKTNMGGFQAGDDDFDPRLDNPDILPTDPILEVTKFPVNCNPVGDGFTTDLPVGVNGAAGQAFQILSLDPTRAIAHVIAVGGPIMVSNDPSSMINGRGAIIPQNVILDVTTSAELWAAIPGATSPVAASASVWFEQVT